MRPTLREDGFQWGGSVPFSNDAWRVLQHICRLYERDDPSLDEHSDRIEDEIDVVTLVHDEVLAPFAKSLDLSEFYHPKWTDVIRRECGRFPFLSRAQMHMHNIAEDGKTHVDAERHHIRLWNVVISLYDDPSMGSTVIYPPHTREKQVDRVIPVAVAAPKFQYFIMDANTLHFRRGAKRNGRRRRMLVLTFSERPVTDVEW